ncbi:MAG: hypothetical protein M3178_09730 [Pseudomonadota bacterium]|nr:hypothetical protein [Pseudomonadota bacterium]
MNGMAAEEAAQVKPKDCKSYFRVDEDAKANMAPPAEPASWFKIVSVPLFNDPEDPNAFSDSVGVVTSWKLPGVFAGVQTGDLAKAQAKINSGDWAQSVQAGGGLGTQSRKCSTLTCLMMCKKSASNGCSRRGSSQVP